jgi:hypothetical protein
MSAAAMDERVNNLVELNEALQQKCMDLRDEFDNARKINYEGSALVTIVQLEENDNYENDGMLMFVYRYDEETDSFILECHMEVNFRTIPDNDDRYKFAADATQPTPLEFVDRKIDQFKDVYGNPPELMA